MAKRTHTSPDASTVDPLHLPPLPLPEPEPGLVVEEGSAEAYARFEGAARALRADQLEAVSVDPVLARHNAVEGAAIVQARRADILQTGLAVDWNAIDNLGTLGLALLWATAQTRAPQGQNLLPKIKRGRVLRRKLLKVLDGLVAFELVPKRDLDAIVAGSGSIDTARDLLALTLVFQRDAAKLAGKHPVDAATLAEASALGTELLRALRPGAGKAFPKANPVVQEGMVERMFTLLAQAYAEVERAAGALWGRAAAKRVPSLRTRTRRRKAAGAAEAAKG